MERPLAIRAARVTEPFGVARGDESCPEMIDFRGFNGVSIALAYRDLGAITCHPHDGITAEFRAHKIVIRGRNLRALYDHMVDHRVTFVQEDDFDALPESATFVEMISIERAQEL